MTARRLLEGGDVVGALAALKQEVRKAPREATLRTFLFQMFCVVGEWDRALTQLAVAAELDPLALPMAQTYQTVIRCEMLREGVFAGTRSPTILGKPEPWMPLLFEANRALTAGKLSEAAALRDEAFEQASGSPGMLNGEAFEWIADADPRIGPALEAILDGTYYWIPLPNIAELKLDPPVDLRDQVWMPAHFKWANGGEAVGFIPSRYPGSATADPQLALGRRTEWVEQGDPDLGWVTGLGQRMFATDTDEHALLDLRSLVLHTEAVSEEAAAPAAG